MKLDTEKFQSIVITFPKQYMEEDKGVVPCLSEPVYSP
jgi:hypothetical protein